MLLADSVTAGQIYRIAVALRRSRDNLEGRSDRISLICFGIGFYRLSQKQGELLAEAEAADADSSLEP